MPHVQNPEKIACRTGIKEPSQASDVLWCMKK